MLKKFLAILLACSFAVFAFPAFADETDITPQKVIDALRTGEGLEALYARFSPEMKAAIPLEALSAMWTQLTLLGGEYEGMADNLTQTQQNGYTVWTQNVVLSRFTLLETLVLDGEGQISGLQLSIDAQKRSDLSLTDAAFEEEVTVGEAPWALPGTLTLPRSETPVPAVVLVHGSGPSNRDEAIGSTALFADLASMLSAKGIAVLRYDKRTYTYGQQIAESPDYASFTVEEETIQDAIAAGRLLAADERIDPNRIYLLGHSLGAMLAPRICAESDGLFAGMILACGTNRSLAEIMLRQSLDAYREQGANENDVQAFEASFRAEMDSLFALAAEEAKGARTQYLSPAYYFWEMAQHEDAASYLRELAMPTLILNGERDFQVNPAEGRETWEACLPMDASWLECFWADVNHLLMRPDVDEAIERSVAAYQVVCHVDETVANAMADWLLKNKGE